METIDEVFSSLFVFRFVVTEVSSPEVLPLSTSQPLFFSPLSICPLDNVNFFSR